MVSWVGNVMIDSGLVKAVECRLYDHEHLFRLLYLIFRHQGQRTTLELGKKS
jgi:hypothetical protein